MDLSYYHIDVVYFFSAGLANCTEARNETWDSKVEWPVQLSVPPWSKTICNCEHALDKSVNWPIGIVWPGVSDSIRHTTSVTNTAPLARARCLLVHKTHNSTEPTRPEPTPTTNTHNKLPWTTWREVSPNYEHSCFFTCNHETKSQRCGVEMRLLFHDHIVEMLNPCASLEFTWHLWWFWHSVSNMGYIPCGRATKPPGHSKLHNSWGANSWSDQSVFIPRGGNAPVKWSEQET